VVSGNVNAKLTSGDTAVLVGRGLTSRQQIKVEVSAAAPGSGITFIVPDPKTDAPVRIPATCDYVVNTLRNVVLGIGAARLCIVEHFLAATTLLRLTDLEVNVSGLEMPLGDGSAQLWIDLLQQSGFPSHELEAEIDIEEAIILQKADRVLMVLPDTKFSISYMIDWDHPLIGKRWQSWDPSLDISEIGSARTFGWLKQHEMLGLENDVVSLTKDGFTIPLRFEDEPVRHKLLDLLGDLALCGINPMRFKGKFVSIKGGHEIDVEMAKKLFALLQD
jgi:UDP-3-O-[3-hydroxymyristoyl] N-acetylglucosamine deacetylase